MLQDESLRYVYQTQLSQFAQQKPISSNINQEWGNIRDVISQAAFEALETRCKIMETKAYRYGMTILDKY